MNLIHLSKKPVKKLSDLTKEKEFLLDEKLANETDPQTGKPVLMICVNGKKTFIPIGEPTKINYANFCLLKDIGIFNSGNNYSMEVDFDPFRNKSS